MHEKDHVIEVLENTRKAINDMDVGSLKDLSDQTIHSASVHQDTDSIAIAIIIYSLSKIIERRKQIGEVKCGEFCNRVSNFIGSAIKTLRESNEEGFSDNLEKIRRAVGKLPGDFKRDVEEVFRKASINKAAKIYEHGISMEQTAKLLGLTMFELANYSGQRDISETNHVKTQSAKERIKLAMEFFK